MLQIINYGYLYLEVILDTQCTFYIKEGIKMELDPIKFNAAIETGKTPIQTPSLAPENNEPLMSFSEDSSQLSSELNSEDTDRLIKEQIAKEENIINNQERSEAKGDANKFVEGQDATQVAWCAAYANNILEQSGVELAPWYQNICQDLNKDGVEDSWTVKNIRNAAKAAESETGKQIITDGSKAQVGDLCFLGSNHVGVLAKVEDDGTLCIVAGNSSDQTAVYMVQPQDYGQYEFANTTGTDRTNVDNGELAKNSANGEVSDNFNGSKYSSLIENRFSQYDENDNSQSKEYWIDNINDFQEYLLEETPAPTPTDSVVIETRTTTPPITTSAPTENDTTPAPTEAEATTPPVTTPPVTTPPVTTPPVTTPAPTEAEATTPPVTTPPVTTPPVTTPPVTTPAPTEAEATTPPVTTPPVTTPPVTTPPVTTPAPTETDDTEIDNDYPDFGDTDTDIPPENKTPSEPPLSEETQTVTPSENEPEATEPEQQTTPCEDLEDTGNGSVPELGEDNSNLENNPIPSDEGETPAEPEIAQENKTPSEPPLSEETQKDIPSATEPEQQTTPCEGLEDTQSDLVPELGGAGLISSVAGGYDIEFANEANDLAALMEEYENYNNENQFLDNADTNTISNVFGNLFSSNRMKDKKK